MYFLISCSIFFDALVISGLALTDIIGLEALLLSNGLMSMTTLKILSSKATHLTHLMSKMAQLNLSLTVDAIKMQKLAKGIIRKSIYVFTLGFVFLFTSL
jgi:hypothetical protein